MLSSEIPTRVSVFSFSNDDIPSMTTHPPTHSPRALEQVMRDVWGLGQFRHQQESVINAAMSGLDTLVLMPTGGGKVGGKKGWRAEGSSEGAVLIP